MLLDYCPGGDLGSVILKFKKIRENIVKIYVAEIVLALGCLHSNSIVFRDLKPENVVLDIIISPYKVQTYLSCMRLSGQLDKLYCSRWFKLYSF